VGPKAGMAGDYHRSRGCDRRALDGFVKRALSDGEKLPQVVIHLATEPSITVPLWLMSRNR
jgi:hypothetical protein